jgi:hypothetical protein
MTTAQLRTSKNIVHTYSNGTEVHYPPNYSGTLGGPHDAIGYLAARQSATLGIDVSKIESHYATFSPDVVGKMLLDELRSGL